MTDALGNTVRFEYDADHNLTTTIDPMGRPTRTVEYDSSGPHRKDHRRRRNSVDLDISADGKQQTSSHPTVA